MKATGSCHCYDQDMFYGKFCQHKHKGHNHENYEPSSSKEDLFPTRPLLNHFESNSIPPPSIAKCKRWERDGWPTEGQEFHWRSNDLLKVKRLTEGQFNFRPCRNGGKCVDGKCVCPEGRTTSLISVDSYIVNSCFKMTRLESPDSCQIMATNPTKSGNSASRLSRSSLS